MPIFNSLGALTYNKNSFYNTNSNVQGFFVKGGPGIGFANLTCRGNGTGVAIDNGGNFYIGTTTLGANWWDGTNGYIAKFDATTGNNLYVKSAGIGATPTVTSNNQLRVQGFSSSLVNGFPTYSSFNTGYDASGAPLNAITYAQGSFPYGIIGARSDNSNNSYAFYVFDTSLTLGVARIYKTNANNTQTGYISITTSIVADRLQGMGYCIDANDNMYIACRSVPNDTSGDCIIKFDLNTNTTLWKTKLNSNSISDIACDNNHVYISSQQGLTKIDGNNGNVVLSKSGGGQNTKIAVHNGNLYFDTLCFSTANLENIWHNSIEFVSWTGNIANTGSIGCTTNNSYVYVGKTFRNVAYGYKIPIDGSIPGIGKYRNGNFVILYKSLPLLTMTNAFVTSSNTANVSATFVTLTGNTPGPTGGNITPSWLNVEFK